MSSKIPSIGEVTSWYNEILIQPNFVKQLDDYEIDRLKEYIEGIIKEKYYLPMLDEFGHRRQSEYPEEIRIPYRCTIEESREKIKKQQQLILSEIFDGTLDKTEIYVLNLLGQNWTPHRQFHKLKVPQPKSKKIAPIKEINAKWAFFINEGQKLSLRQIALLCVYEGIYPDMTKKENKAQKIANFHDKNSETSGQQLYTHYDKVRKPNDRIFVPDKRAMKNDIQKILPLISELKKGLACKDVEELEKLMKKE